MNSTIGPEDLSGSEVPGVVILDANKHVKAEFTAIAEGEEPRLKAR